ncbi:MAG: ATP-binding protein [Gammaproteobacteria bacterium]
MFNIFERLDVGEGTGVGLAIVKTAMDKHDGKIELHSVFGEGSVFTLEFPNKIGEVA